MSDIALKTLPGNYVESDLRDLRDLLTSDEVNEVVVNPDGGVWVEYAHTEHMQKSELVFEDKVIKRVGTHLAGESNNTLGDNHPIVSGRVMAFGQSLRVQIIVPPAIEVGVSLSIRKYVSRILDLKEIVFLEGRQINVEKERERKLNSLLQLADEGDLGNLFRRAIDDRLNILISGSTSSGKTTMARALLAMAHDQERLVTIEDAAELHLPHENKVSLISDRIKGSPRAPARLLESALRMRPDRLILGEMRGEEALSFLKAINTGHPGSISTIHADSCVKALESIAMKVMEAGTQFTRQDVIDYAIQTIDMIVQVGRSGGRRGVLEVYVPMLADADT